MVTQSTDLKSNALKLRIEGNSLRTIEKELGISKSTLHNWFKEIELTPNQKQHLDQIKLQTLKRAREKASAWHKDQKQKRIKEAQEKASKLIREIKIDDKNLQIIALAMLYLGEGFKKNDETGLGNTNPTILKFFLKLYTDLFEVGRDSVRCELYLRADQDIEKMKQYWAHELELPIKSFTHVHLDKRTTGTKTFESYKGVCTIRCGNVAVKRQLLYIAEGYCNRILMGG